MQRSAAVRFEWGLRGAESVVDDVDVAVVVDVLSFTTTLTVALDAGITVLPYRWADASSAEFAEQHNARLAVARADADPGQISLSPASIRATADLPSKLVLPSPNGSTIARAVSSGAACCVGAAFRNADAVCAWIGREHDPQKTRVAVIAAGEQWPDGSMRPAVEDLWGAGAIIFGLLGRGWAGLSPEAETACAAYESTRSSLRAKLYSTASGRELVDAGFRDDVTVATELDVSGSVPLLTQQGFVPAPD